MVVEWCRLMMSYTTVSRSAPAAHSSPHEAQRRTQSHTLEFRQKSRL